MGVGDGPASFNAQATRNGWRVTSVDPIYQFPAEQRFEAVVDRIFDQVYSSPDDWTWSFHKGPDSLRACREKAVRDFAEDFGGASGDGRYVIGELPVLPFRARTFDIALCSHLLFLYSDFLDLKFHTDSIAEMLRVAGEVRIFPLLSLDLTRSCHLDGVIEKFTARGYAVHIDQVAYELQKGGNEQLVIKGVI
jgi:hypothetical protein